jgi:hypothetical protein
MKRFSDYHSINETLEQQLKDKLSEDYKSLKRGILDLLDKTLKTDKLVDVQNFIDGYIKNPEKTTIEGFVDDADIFDFYLKYQNNIDEACTNNKYFENAPMKNNMYSLYDIVIDGSRFAVLQCMKIMKNELFQ